MKKLTASGLVIVLSSFAIISAQTPDMRASTMGMTTDHNSLRDYANNWKNNVNRSVNMDDLKKEAKGTPYFDDKFYTAKIDNFITPDKLRYNAFSDQMEFLKDNITYEVNKIEGLRIFLPDINTFYITKTIKEDNKENIAYLKELKRGRIVLLERQKITLKGGNGINNGMVDNTGYSFIPQKSIYYAMYKDNLFVVPKTVSEFQKFLNDPELSKNQVFNKKYNLNKLSDLLSFIDEINK